MSDIKEYLPKSRKLFRAFIKSKHSNFREVAKHSKVGSTSGYNEYYRHREVTQHSWDILLNLEERFGYVNIPENFSSPKQLTSSWLAFYEFLKDKDLIFDDILKRYSKDPEILPFPFSDVYKMHTDVLELFKEIIQMDEVQSYLKPAKGIKGVLSTKEFDVVIITALYKTEYEELLKLPIKFTAFKSPNDSTMYHQGKIGAKTILIATDDKMGMSSSSSLATKVLFKFNPEYLIMAGIAAGVKDDEKNYGDILIARSTWNYESGKYKYKMKPKSTVFEPNPEQIDIHSDLVHVINELSINEPLLEKIKNDFTTDAKNSQPKKDLKVFFGPMASGSAVVADERKVQDIRRNNRKLIGIDMETFGVYYAAKAIRSDYQTKVISIKSISDFADTRKSDKYRKFAAFTSSRFTYELIKTKL